MVKERMDLLELLHKGGMDGDVDFLREALRVLVEGIMDAEVSSRIGAEYGERSPERVPQRTVGSFPIVISSPRLHLFLSVFKGQEPVLVQALLPETSVECLDGSVVRGLAGPTEVQLHSVQVSPPTTSD